MSERPPAGAATRYGQLRGTRVGDVCAFRGGPFAQAPARFAAPEPPSPWSGVREAGCYAAAAPQNHGDALSRLFVDHANGQSEDV